LETSKRTELQRFAASFHQDWDIEGIDYFEGARHYVRALPVERRYHLKLELRGLIETNATASAKGMTNIWIKLGSDGGWQPEMDIRDGLRQFYEIIAGEKFD
jgi:hypothetical protein